MTTKVISLLTDGKPDIAPKGPSLQQQALVNQWLQAVDLVLSKPSYVQHMTIAQSTINASQWEARLGGVLLAWSPSRQGIFAILSYIFLLASQCDPDDPAYAQKEQAAA